MKISESMLALVRAMSNFNYTYDFSKSTELLSEIERLDLSSEHLKFINHLKTLCKDLERIELPEIPELKKHLDNSWAIQLEKDNETLQNLFYSIYSCGYRISDFKKVLIYLASFTTPAHSSKKDVVENWTISYIDALLLFFSGMEAHKELVEHNKEYLKNN